MAINAGTYAEAILSKLLPRGSAWIDEAGTRLRELLRAMAELLVSLHLRALVLLEELDPRTTHEMLTDWERALGLPGDCAPLGETLQQRRVAVLDILTATGGANAAYFIALAESLGHSGVTISEFNPFRIGDRIGDSLSGDSAQFAWQVNIPQAETITDFRVGLSAVGEPLRAWGNERFECAFLERKPAHTKIVFAYGS